MMWCRLNNIEVHSERERVSILLRTLKRDKYVESVVHECVHSHRERERDESLFHTHTHTKGRRKRLDGLGSLRFT